MTTMTTTNSVFNLCKSHWEVETSPCCIQHSKNGIRTGASHNLRMGWQRICICVCLLVLLAAAVNSMKVGSVRLRGGVQNDTRAYGRVEVWMPGWYTICDTGWDTKDAGVVCSQLNYTHGMALCCDAVGYNYYAQARMDYVACVGNETGIIDCRSQEPSTLHRFCHLRNYASALCTRNPSPTAYSAIYIGSAIQPSGDVKLRYANVNGSICSDNWSDLDAKVACREAGYKNGTAYTHYRGVSNGPFWTSDVNCTGNETRLSQCEHAGFGKVTKCISGHHAGALCYTKGLEFRLAGSPERNKGRFEVSIDGVWGTVCNTSWNTPDTTVFCRQIGFAGGSVTRDDYGGAPLKMFTTGMACLGTEKHLLSCPHTGWSEVGATDRRCPDHSYDVTIVCHGPVRLVSSVPIPVHGPIMYYLRTYWSLVCDQGFDDYTAKLACVSMGFVDGRAICCSAYGPGRFISSFTMSCTGNETSIEECVRPIACNSSHYASVICFRENQIPITEEYRFGVHREKEAHGQVTVRHYGITGRICYQHWSDSEAKVLCRSLGYKAGVAYHHTLYGQTRATSPYMISNVTCSGTESDVSQCQFNGRLDVGNCAAQHMAGALCLNKSEDVEYRLAGGGYNYGRVEVGVDGEWGTICSTWWGYSETRVLCKQLGFPLGGKPMGMGNITRVNGTVWMSHLQCAGTEKSLHDCRHVGFDTAVSDLYGRYPDGRIVYYPGCHDDRRSDAAAWCFENITTTTAGTTTSLTMAPTTPQPPPIMTTPPITPSTRIRTTERRTTPTTRITTTELRTTPTTTVRTTQRRTTPTPRPTPTARPTTPRTTPTVTPPTPRPRSTTTSSRPTPPILRTTTSRETEASPKPVTTETDAPPKEVTTETESPPETTMKITSSTNTPIVGGSALQDDDDDDDGVSPAAIVIPIILIILIICAIVFIIMFTARRRQRKDPFHHDRLHEDNNSVGFREDGDLPGATGNWNNNAGYSNGTTPNGGITDYVYYDKENVQIGREATETQPPIIDPLYSEVYTGNLEADDHGIVNPGYFDDGVLAVATDPTLPVPEEHVYYKVEQTTGDSTV